MTEASPQLVKSLIRMVDADLVVLRRNPPADPDSEDGKRHWRAVEQLQAQLDRLYQSAEFLARNPPPQGRPRRTWRDIYRRGRPGRPACLVSGR